MEQVGEENQWKFFLEQDREYFTWSVFWIFSFKRLLFQITDHPPVEEAHEAINFSSEAEMTTSKATAPIVPGEMSRMYEKHKSESAEPFPEPRIDPKTGDWILSAFDVECLHIGAGIMGCGGGGSPYLGRLCVLEALKAGKQIRVIHPDK